MHSIQMLIVIKYNRSRIKRKFIYSSACFRSFSCWKNNEHFSKLFSHTIFPNLIYRISILFKFYLSSTVFFNTSYVIFLLISYVIIYTILKKEYFPYYFFSNKNLISDYYSPRDKVYGERCLFIREEDGTTVKLRRY